MALYDGWRKDGGPTLYGPLKTAVTADVLEAGFIFAIVILAFSLLLILPGIRGRQKIFSCIRIVIGCFVLGSIFIVNFGQEWEVASVDTKTQYRAGLREEIHARIGVKIGLRSINITLKGDPEVTSFENGKVNETINYNERFSWNNEGFHLGRAGFGPFAGLFNREFRAGQRKGLPYPILWVAEYFTIDGEGIRWGRHYLQAGYYAHIMVWLAFPLWVLTMMLFYMVMFYGGLFSLFTGGSLLMANILYATIRNPNDLKIPFEDGFLIFSWGWSFWLCLVNGLLCCIIGIVVLAMDFWRPDTLATFFNIDIAAYFEELYVDPKDLKVKTEKSGLSRLFTRRSPSSNGLAASGGSSVQMSEVNVEVEQDDDEDPGEIYENADQVQQVRMFRKRTIMGPKLRGAPVPTPKGGEGHTNPAFER